LEQLEFDVNGTGTLKIFWYGYFTREPSESSSQSSPLVLKFNYTISPKNIFEILYDGLMIFPNSSPERWKYFKIQGSDMLVSEGPDRYDRYKKMQ
jgi:hypothetical protein